MLPMVGVMKDIYPQRWILFSHLLLWFSFPIFYSSPFLRTDQNFYVLFKTIPSHLLSHLITHTHTHLRRFSQDYPGEPVPEENLLLNFYGSRGDNRGRHTDHPDGLHSVRTNQRPISNMQPFLCRMSFLPQPSHFIPAWERHQICRLAYPEAPNDCE